MKKPKSSSGFADFVRNASSREKKRVYMRALKEATDEQAAVIASAKKHTVTA